MSGNGVRIGMGIITLPPKRTPRALPVVRPVCVAGVVGTAARGTVAYPFGATTTPPAGTSTTGSVWFCSPKFKNKKNKNIDKKLRERMSRRDF